MARASSTDTATDEPWVGAPEEWRGVESAGPGRFARTHRVWELPDGTRVEWNSRDHRLGAAPLADGPSEVRTSRRAAMFTRVVAVGFAIGSSLFVAGAALAQFSDTADDTIAWVYFTGGIFFSLSAYLSILQLLNADHRLRAGRAERRGWRWWAVERSRIDWVSAFVLFLGTLVFGVNLVFSFADALGAVKEDVLVWTPDVVGCVLFLVSGWLAIQEVTHGTLRPDVHDVGWWITVINLSGSILFMASALASFTRPVTGEVVSAGMSNWGTLLGAACFFVAAALMPLQLRRAG